MKITEELSNAYFATEYKVYLTDRDVVLSARGESYVLRDLLQNHHVKTCAFITAYNPSSIKINDVDNIRRQADLIAKVGGKWKFYTGEGVDSKGRWLAEKSILILGISLEQTRDLATRYGQNAFLFGYENGKTELIATDPEEQNNLKHPLERAAEELDKILNATPFTEEELAEFHSGKSKARFVPRRLGKTS